MITVQANSPSKTILHVPVHFVVPLYSHLYVIEILLVRLILIVYSRYFLSLY